MAGGIFRYKLSINTRIYQLIEANVIKRKMQDNCILFTGGMVTLSLRVKQLD